MQAGEAALLSLTPTIAGRFIFEWLPATEPANSKDHR